MNGRPGVDDPGDTFRPNVRRVAAGSDIHGTAAQCAFQVLLLRPTASGENEI